MEYLNTCPDFIICQFDKARSVLLSETDNEALLTHILCITFIQLFTQK